MNEDLMHLVDTEQQNEVAKENIQEQQPTAKPVVGIKNPFENLEDLPIEGARQAAPLMQISENGHRKPPKTGAAASGSADNRALVKRLNAEKRAREKKMAEALKIKEDKFKLELEEKEREQELKLKQKEEERMRKREEAQQRINERQAERARSLMFMKEETKKIGRSYRSGIGRREADAILALAAEGGRG